MPHEKIAIIVLAGCILGNFVSQALMRREWGTAAERSYFQAVAVIAVLLVQRINTLL